VASLWPNLNFDLSQLLQSYRIIFQYTTRNFYRTEAATTAAGRGTTPALSVVVSSFIRIWNGALRIIPVTTDENL
jgi:hypothetical protein